MFENRIKHYYDLSESTSAFAGTQPAFVACPAPLMAAFTPAQQFFIAEIYRRALELTESQLRKPARRTIPEFSLNWHADHHSDGTKIWWRKDTFVFVISPWLGADVWHSSTAAIASYQPDTDLDRLILQTESPIGG
jgi:hypothetical protein